MTKERLEKIFETLKREGYMPEYLYLEFDDKNYIGIRLEKRVKEVEKAIIEKMCGELDFFELRCSDEDDFWISGLKKHVFVNFDSTFLIDKDEIKIDDEEELEVREYDFISYLEDYIKD